MLPFAKLRAGGQSRRFQVLARNSPAPRDPAALDALVLQRLMGWLAAHRGAWNSQPTSFTVNLSIATLEDERFAQKMAATLNSHGIAAETHRLRDRRGAVHAAPRAGGALHHPVRQGGLLGGDR